MSEQTLTDFKRTVAHELKNPLGAAKGALELLREEELQAPEQRDRMLELALRNVERAITLLDELR